ncbi:MAG: hypothetical protein NC331_11290 [Lachnospiraceae bacterium]|nr:hypothetical protein [Lachnospiraceae bacterium]MCM1239951.1 hypothetical protein [Lachnospiraceae bacterium]
MEDSIEKSFPFDSDEVDGEYDRGYLADDFARYFRAFISSGTFLKERTNLQVLANDDMTVTLRPGKMMIDGYRYEALEDIIIPISPADGLLDRIDRIAITWSLGDRDIHYTIREGDPGYRPTAPECRRSAEYKDYVVADIYVAANRISITQSAITDQRLNSDVCGLAFPFMDIDTRLIFDQLQAFYQETVEANAIWTDQERNRFYGWLDQIQTSGNSQMEAIIKLLSEFEASSEQQWREWFDGIRDALASAENGEMLEELTRLFRELYETATDRDIDQIIGGTYVDVDSQSSIFEAGTNQDIDDIIGGAYVDTAGSGTSVAPDMEDIVNSAFENA